MKEIFVQQHGAKPRKVNDVPYFLNNYFQSTVITNLLSQTIQWTCMYLYTLPTSHSLNTIPSVLFIITRFWVTKIQVLPKKTQRFSEWVS